MKTRKGRSMAVYWINLDRSTERHENMLKVLKDPVFDGMSKHRVKAIDGKNITKEELETRFENVGENQPVKDYCCLLSQLKTLSLFLKSSYSMAIIFEDDISLEYKPYWRESIQDCIHNAPKDWEVIKLSYILDSKKKLPTKMYTKEKDLMYAGGAAYIVNKKGARQFLNKPIFDKTLSHIPEYYLFLSMNTYTYKYPYFTYTAKDSTLHTDHIDEIHIPSKQRIEAWLKKNTIV